MNIILLILIAIWSGWLEQMHFRSGSRPWRGFDGTDRTKVFGWVIVAYHGPLLAGWCAMCWLAGALWFVPAFCVLEDYGYWRFHPERLDPAKSVCCKLGGLYLWGNAESKNNLFLPWTYVAGLGLSALLWFLF